MEQISEYIKSVSSIKLVDIIIAICIIIFFRIFRSTIAYIIISMFKLKTKNRKRIKESTFYNPLKVFFSILGVYIAILFLQQPLKISNDAVAIITKIFKIISVIIFTKGFLASFTLNSSLIKKIKERTNQNIEDSMFEFLLKIARAVIYIIAGFIIITLLGINLNGLVAGLGVSGVIVTLAAQDTAKNLFGGLVIFIDKPFSVGDYIQITPYEGTVEDITFRSTRVRTLENSLVNIPNSIISNSSIVNYSKIQKRRHKINLCIQINTPLDKIEKFQKRVIQMLQQREKIYNESIIVKFDEITDNGINILICSYTSEIDYTMYLQEKEEINCEIMKILREEDIELTYDTKTVYLKKEN